MQSFSSLHTSSAALARKQQQQQISTQQISTQMQLSGRQLSAVRSARSTVASRVTLPRQSRRQRALVVHNMFTGIVQGLAAVAHVNEADSFKSFKIQFPPGKADGIQIGASVAINGTCLTVTAIEQDVLSFDVMSETLRATSLGALKVSGWAGVAAVLRCQVPCAYGSSTTQQLQQQFAAAAAAASDSARTAVRVPQQHSSSSTGTPRHIDCHCHCRSSTIPSCAGGQQGQL